MTHSTCYGVKEWYIQDSKNYIVARAFVWADVIYQTSEHQKFRKSTSFRATMLGEIHFKGFVELS